MNLIDIFPKTIGSVLLHEDINLYKKYLLEQPINYFTESDATTTNERILDTSIFKPLVNNIILNTKEYLNQLNIIYSDIQIISSWAYFSRKGNVPNNFHYHANSFISGVFYLTPGCDIIFKKINHNFFTPKSNDKIGYRDDLFSVTPQENLLLLFPSELSHAIGDQNIDGTRISIAFNIIPKGEFGDTTRKIWI